MTAHIVMKNEGYKINQFFAVLGTLLHMKVQTSPDAWFMIGIVPHTPKTKIEHQQAGQRAEQVYELPPQLLPLCVVYYFNRNRGIAIPTSFGELFKVTGKGWIQLHIKVANLISDVEGQDEMCCRYASHSIPISKADSP